MFNYYVYAYIRKSNGLPYYIGKGKDKRAFTKHRGISTPKDVSKIVFLETNLSEVGALALERRYIKWYGRKINSSGILLNKTEGGDGISGYKHNRKPLSIEHKNKISASITGSKNPFFGKKHNSEMIKHFSEVKIGSNNPMYGKKQSSVHNKAVSKQVISPDGIIYESKKQIIVDLKIMSRRQLDKLLRNGTWKFNLICTKTHTF